MRTLQVLAIATALSLAAATTAIAQEDTATTAAAPAQAMAATTAAAPAPQISYRSPAGAFLLSFLGTAVPMVASAPGAFADYESGSAASAWTFLLAPIIGPSLGHFYAGRPGHAFAGIGIRAAALVGLAGAFAIAWDSDSGFNSADVLAAASLGLGGISAIYDIATAPSSAAEHNRRAAARNVSVTVVPLRHGAQVAATVAF